MVDENGAEYASSQKLETHNPVWIRNKETKAV